MVEFRRNGRQDGGVERESLHTAASSYRAMSESAGQYSYKHFASVQANLVVAVGCWVSGGGFAGAVGERGAVKLCFLVFGPGRLKLAADKWRLVAVGLAE